MTFTLETSIVLVFLVSTPKSAFLHCSCFIHQRLESFSCVRDQGSVIHIAYITDVLSADESAYKAIKGSEKKLCVNVEQDGR